MTPSSVNNTPDAPIFVRGVYLYRAGMDGRAGAGFANVNATAVDFDATPSAMFTGSPQASQSSNPLQWWTLACGQSLIPVPCLSSSFFTNVRWYAIEYDLCGLAGEAP
eukprot:353005-Chlamydomonas_euryale.AAC.1